MALIVFIRGVNVGGHRTFRPSIVARDLSDYDVLNVGAAGTFVVRKPGSRAKFRTALLRKTTKEAQAGVNVGKIIIGPQTSTEDVTVKNGKVLANHEVEKSSSAMFGTEKAEATVSKGDFGVGAEVDAGVLVVGFEVGVDFDKVRDLFGPH